MGHSSINISLNYVRGLELPELKQEDTAYGLVVTLFSCTIENTRIMILPSVLDKNSN